jgi:aspartate/methionine/tyrosine aminotransferase
MRQFPASPISALIDSEPLYNLGESLGPDLTVASLLGSSGLARLGQVNLGYGSSAGDPVLRALVAARHGIPDSQVLITAGAAGALFLLAVLCGDGEVVIGQPGYPPMLDALRGIGAQVAVVRSRFENGYRPDLGALTSTLSPRTQLVAFASPQNPAGVALTGSEVDQILAAMSRTCPEALLLIDETFREATYGDRQPAPSFAGRSPRLLTCASLSKAYGAPGLRIGWLTIPGERLYEQFRLAKFNSSLSCGAVDEFLATALLSQADRVLAARGALMAHSLDIVEQWVKSHDGRLRWLRPEAGAFCCLQLDPGSFAPRDADLFHARLARQQTMVAQGTWFGDSPLVFRLGLAYEPAEKLQKGLESITTALEGGES